MDLQNGWGRKRPLEVTWSKQGHLRISLVMKRMGNFLDNLKNSLLRRRHGHFPWRWQKYERKKDVKFKVSQPQSYSRCVIRLRYSVDLMKGSHSFESAHPRQDYSFNVGTPAFLSHQWSHPFPIGWKCFERDQLILDNCLENWKVKWVCEKAIPSTCLLVP